MVAAVFDIMLDTQALNIKALESVLRITGYHMLLRVYSFHNIFTFFPGQTLYNHVSLWGTNFYSLFY